MMSCCSALLHQQVKQNCEMESHEEKLHKMIIQSKINDTKDIMKRKVGRPAAVCCCHNPHAATSNMPLSDALCCRGPAKRQLMVSVVFSPPNGVTRT